MLKSFNNIFDMAKEIILNKIRNFIQGEEILGFLKEGGVDFDFDFDSN